jgi:hypothetical protein
VQTTDYPPQESVHPDETIQQPLPSSPMDKACEQAGTSARRKGLGRIFEPAAHYPRAAVELVLVVASVALGFVYLPALGVPTTASQMAIPYIELDESANVPTYVLDRPADASGPQNQVTIGMNVPAAGPPVHWWLFIDYAKGDGVSNVDTPSGVSEGTDSTPNEVEFWGTMKPGSVSYTEYQHGYLENQLSNIQIPKDTTTVTFVLRGPAQSRDVMGSTLSVEQPAIAAFVAPANLARNVNNPPPPTTFLAEVLFDAGSYELQGSGPTVTGTPGHLMWDWMGPGGIQQQSAIGTDNGKAQTDQVDLVLAGALFGLTGAAAAALALELVVAFQEHHRQYRRRKGPDLSGRTVLS